MGDHAPRVDVAGIVFRITGLDASGCAWVERRYAPFLSRRPATVNVDVSPTARYRRGRVPRPSASWGDGRFALVSYPARAEGSLATASVSVRTGPGPAISTDVFRLLCGFLLLQEGGVLLHASAVVDRGRAWVFSGPSGSGKTTLAGLAGPRRVLNDETIALRPSPDGWTACATPFYGSGGPAMAEVNERAPVRALCFLGKADRFAHRRLSPAEAVGRAFPEVMLPKRDARVAGELLGALAGLACRVPAYDVHFAPRAAIWDDLDGLG